MKSVPHGADWSGRRSQPAEPEGRALVPPAPTARPSASARLAGRRCLPCLLRLTSTGPRLLSILILPSGRSQVRPHPSERSCTSWQVSPGWHSAQLFPTRLPRTTRTLTPTEPGRGADWRELCRTLGTTTVSRHGTSSRPPQGPPGIFSSGADSHQPRRRFRSRSPVRLPPASRLRPDYTTSSFPNAP